MVVPRLIHRAPVTIQSLDIANTVYDNDYREPVQQSKRAAGVIVQGQPKWEGKELEITVGGVQIKCDGYVLFRYRDLTAKSITLKQNDRFTKIGKQVTDVYVVKLTPCAHYTDQGGATMVKAFFMDREPARQGLAI